MNISKVKGMLLAGRLVRPTFMFTLLLMGMIFTFCGPVVRRRTRRRKSRRIRRRGIVLSLFIPPKTSVFLMVPVIVRRAVLLVLLLRVKLKILRLVIGFLVIILLRVPWRRFKVPKLK